MRGRAGCRDDETMCGLSVCKRDPINAAAEGGRYQHLEPGQDLKPVHYGVGQALSEQRPVRSQVGREKDTSVGACIQSRIPRLPVDRQRPHRQVRGNPTIEPRPGRSSIIGHPDSPLGPVAEGHSLITRLTSFARSHLNEDVVRMCRIDHDVQRFAARCDWQALITLQPTCAAAVKGCPEATIRSGGIESFLLRWRNSDRRNVASIWRKLLADLRPFSTAIGCLPDARATQYES
jgi:hypothetical protein